MRKYSVIIILILLLHPFLIWAKYIELFEIKRNRNNDVIMYSVAIDTKNQIDSRNPIKCEWQNETNGKTSPLTYIQNKFGYGVKIIENTSTSCTFYIAAIPDQLFIVQNNSNSKYKSYTIVHNKEVLVNSIFIAFKEGTVWVPEIDSIQLNCTDCISNKNILKIIYAK